MHQTAESESGRYSSSKMFHRYVKDMSSLVNLESTVCVEINVCEHHPTSGTVEQWNKETLGSRSINIHSKDALDR